MPEPDWKAELRDQLDALSGSYPDLHRVGPLRAVVVSLVEVHIEGAYKRGLMAGRSQAGYTTRRKKKESDPCTATAEGRTPASPTDEP